MKTARHTPQKREARSLPFLLHTVQPRCKRPSRYIPAHPGLSRYVPLSYPVSLQLGVDSKEVSKAIAELKKEGKVMSPKRCYYAPAE